MNNSQVSVTIHTHTHSPTQELPNLRNITLARNINIVQIPSELIKAGGRTFSSEIHKNITSVWNKEELPEEWKESNVVPIYIKGDKKKVVVIIGACHFCQLRTTYFTTSCFQSWLQYAGEIIGDHQRGFQRNSLTTDHIIFMLTVHRSSMWIKRPTRCHF